MIEILYPNKNLSYCNKFKTMEQKQHKIHFQVVVIINGTTSFHVRIKKTLLFLFPSNYLNKGIPFADLINIPLTCNDYYTILPALSSKEQRSN